MAEGPANGESPNESVTVSTASTRSSTDVGVVTEKVDETWQVSSMPEPKQYFCLDVSSSSRHTALVNTISSACPKSLCVCLRIRRGEGDQIDPSYIRILDPLIFYTCGHFLYRPL